MRTSTPPPPTHTQGTPGQPGPGGDPGKPGPPVSHYKYQSC